MAKFYLNTKKESGTASLYTRIQKKGLNLQISTGIKVDIVAWKKSLVSKKNEDAYRRTVDGRQVYTLMLQVEEAIDSVIEKHKNPTSENFSTAIADVVFHDTREVMRKEEEIRKKDEEFINDALSPSVYDLMSELVDDMKKHKRLTKGNHPYSHNAIKPYSSMLHFVKPYMQEHYINAKRIDSKYIKTMFDSLVRSRSLLEASYNVYVTKFFYLLSLLVDDEIIADASLLRLKRQLKQRVIHKRITNVYLTAEELQVLLNYDFKDTKLNKVRDIFLVGCYTCQRISDFSRIRPEHFSVTAKGNKVIRIEQVKTKTKVVIPIISSNLTKVLERNNYDMTLYRYVKKSNSYVECGLDAIDSNIRVIFEILSHEVESLRTIIQGKERWQYVTSHTARRTGITLLFLTGKFTNRQIMSISGHKDENTFLQYVKSSSDDIADIISDMLKDSDDLF